MSEALVEVRFKGARQEIYRNPLAIPLRVGDSCIVSADRGEDMGEVAHFPPSDFVPPEGETLHEVIRRAEARDQANLSRNRSREEEARAVCLGRIEARKLEMKLVDVEMQYDGNKITFYFTAEKRIDFRELVKDLASTFKTRIELRQIGVRDEAKRLDGIGPCGRTLCCSTFLRDFAPVTLRMARDQQLALSPNKISGVCGRLMCCLAYERSEYLQALRAFPRVGARVRTANTEGKVTKADIFSRTVTIRAGEEREIRVLLEEITEEFHRDRWVPRNRGEA
ncbi:MAG: stage 0 sporulation family protein [Candidatus Eisenbacteria bacterium]|nr:stage 0 sporulation family protein [Candidatus Eisenbacteria bacterium]